MSRTSAPRVIPYIYKKGNSLFAIMVIYYSRISQKGVTKQTGGYPSEAEALKDVPHFVNALNSTSRGQKLQSKSFTSRSESESVLMHSTAILLFPPAVSTALNVVENNHLRLTRKNRDSHDDVILKRGDFKNVFRAGTFLTARDRRAEARLRLT